MLFRSEVVFYDTVIDATCEYYKEMSPSLINGAGWLSTLGGTTVRNVEYGTVEMSGVNNSSSRVSWVPVSNEAKTSEGNDIAVSTFLGNWDPFEAHGDDMTVVLPDGTEIPAPQPSAETPAAQPSETPVADKYVLDASDLEVVAQNTFKDGETLKAGTDDRFEMTFSSVSSIDSNNKTFEDGVSGSKRINFRKPASADYGTVKFTTGAAATVKVW